MEKKLYLTGIYGGKAKVIKEGIRSFLVAEMAKLKKQPQYKNYEFQIRNPDAFKSWPIYNPTNKNNKK